VTTRRTYECNLCHERIGPADEPFTKRGIGIYFMSRPEWLTERNVSDVEHHLCWDCLRAIQRLPAPPESPTP
jgi:hypothetical protein